MCRAPGGIGKTLSQGIAASGCHVRERRRWITFAVEREDSSRAGVGTASARPRTIASNTGCMSVGDWLITLQDLARRRLLLERLLGLVEQAHVLDRDHRLVGEGLEQRDLLVRKWPGSAGRRRWRRSHVPRARAAPSMLRNPGYARSATHRKLASSSTSGIATALHVRIALRSRHVAAGRPRPEAADRLGTFRSRVRRAPPDGSARRRSVKTLAEAGAAELHCALATMASNTGCTSVGELADHPQDLARRRLPLERLLGLVEQAHVLDRDHRLVGEGLAAARSAGREMARFGAADADRADRCRRACSGTDSTLR